MVNIYILKLENDKYYVGKTEYLDIRIEHHITGKGSVWTKKYKPVKIIEIIPNCDDFDEDKYTIMYMSKYGIENVRGGSYCELILNEERKNNLNNILNGANDKCYKCGEKGHFVKNCTKKESTDSGWFGKIFETIKNINITLNINNNEETESTDKSSSDESESSNEVVCYRCGREGHYANRCFAKTNVYGYKIK